MNAFEGGYHHSDTGLSQQAVLECKICWTVYDPAKGCEFRQIDPGTPFTALPEDWTCPTCGAEKTQFLVQTDPGAPAMLEEAMIRSRTRALEAEFTEIWHSRMRDVPMVNRNLEVRAIGFRLHEGRLLGVLLSPWFMNLILLPAEGEDWDRLTPGAKEVIAFPSGRYEFTHNTRPMIGGYKACSLFSTMGDFKTQADAVEVAGAVMQALFNEENRAETDRAADIRAAREAEVAADNPPPIDPEPSRRAVSPAASPAPKPGTKRPLMLDTAGIWRVDAPPGPEAQRLAVGKPVGEAREMLGRVFNLCRAAQTAGFDIATGAVPETEAIAAEIRRDHLMQIFMAWPRALGLTPWFDRDWLTDDHAALVALFGPPPMRRAAISRWRGFWARGRRRPASASDRRGLRTPHGACRGASAGRCRNRVPRGGRRKLPRRAAGLAPRRRLCGGDVRPRAPVAGGGPGDRPCGDPRGPQPPPRDRARRLRHRAGDARLLRRVGRDRERPCQDARPGSRRPTTCWPPAARWRRCCPPAARPRDAAAGSDDAGGPVPPPERGGRAMHEMSLVEGMREILENQARAHAVDRITRVRVEIGRFAGVEKPALEFAWDVVMRGSKAEGAELSCSTCRAGPCASTAPARSRSTTACPPARLRRGKADADGRR
jgi:[NiFe] hydrogenase assembly HybE family chaperone